MGSAYSNLNEKEETIEAFKNVIKINPDNKNVHYKMGVIYNEPNKYKEAIGAYQKVIKINPDKEEAIVQLAKLNGK